MLILLMVQKSCGQQLRLVAYLIIYDGFLYIQIVVVWDFWTNNSISQRNSGEYALRGTSHIFTTCSSKNSGT